MSLLIDDLPKLDHHETNIVRKLREDWDNRLCFPPRQIAERYLRGDLAVLVEFPLEFGGHGNLPRKVCAHLSHQLQRSLHVSRGMGNNKFAMLVDNVHFVDGPERITGRGISVIRLQFLDELERSAVGHSLYFSFVTGEFLFRRWPRIKNGEFEILPISGLSSGIVGEFPNDVIHARPEMMDDLTGENAKSQRNTELFEIGQRLVMFLTVYLGHDGVFAFLNERGDFGAEISDVLVGPF